MRFVLRILAERSSSEAWGYLWRIKSKVARHMYGILVRRARDFDLESLPEPGPAEQRQLLATHPLLQPDEPQPVVVERAECMTELRAKVTRFADRMRRRRSGG